MSSTSLFEGASLAATLIGESPAMRETRSLIERLGPTSFSVLIEGPTGVGKELVAQALHRASRRRGSLIAVNVCAIPEAIFESLLFGHVRGAFTGAISDHVGHVTEAHSGTLFLDEIGDLPLSLQSKLLRVLETRSFRKVGGRHDEASDFRLIVATNADLKNAVNTGQFRADLAYRFGAAVIRIPPLRERIEDVSALARYFAAKVSGRLPEITEGALETLRSHSWPGNVRELRHVVELACMFIEGHCLGARAIEAALSLRGPIASGPEAKVALSSSEDAQLRRLLMECLERHAWHVPSAARELGVTKKTVYARIQRLGIRIPGRYQRRLPPESSVDLRAVRSV